MLKWLFQLKFNQNFLLLKANIANILWKILKLHQNKLWHVLM